MFCTAKVSYYMVNTYESDLEYHDTVLLAQQQASGFICPGLFFWLSGWISVRIRMPCCTIDKKMIIITSQASSS